MSVDPSDTSNAPGTNPNRGMNTRPYLVALLVAIIILLGLALFFVRSASHAAPSPKTGTTTTTPAQ